MRGNKKLRNELNFSNPIIALTANVIEDVKEKCYKTGMNDIVTKPFKPDLLYQTITSWITHKTL